MSGIFVLFFFFLLLCAVQFSMGLFLWEREGGGMAATFNGRRIRSRPTCVCVCEHECDGDAACAQGSEEGRQSQTAIVVATLLAPTVAAT